MVHMAEKIVATYDKEFDTLYLYREGVKAKGAVEIGDFIVEFTDQLNKAVAVEILNATRVLTDLSGKRVTKEMLSEVTKASIKTIHKPGAVYVAYSIACKANNKPSDISNAITIPIKA